MASETPSPLDIPSTSPPDEQSAGIEPETVQEAVSVIREAYHDECHLAASAVIARVRAGEITTDEGLWDAIVDTHQARIKGESVTPKWTPLLLSEYWFDDAPSVPAGARRESDVLWEYNRIAWVNDVCHVMREHHSLVVEGTTRERFISGNPLDSLLDRREVIRRVTKELRAIVEDEPRNPLGPQLLHQIRRLEYASRALNPSPSASRER